MNLLLYKIVFDEKFQREHVVEREHILSISFGQEVHTNIQQTTLGNEEVGRADGSATRM